MYPKQCSSFSFCALLALTCILPAAAQAGTITVTGAADAPLATLAGNVTCDLREAIQAANTDTAVGQCPAGSGADTIVFNISGSGLHVIQIETASAGALPDITTNLSIDGYTQPSSTVNTSALAFDATLQIALFSLNGGVTNGLHYTAGASGTVRGLVIGGFTYGINIDGASNVNVHGNVASNDGSGSLHANGVAIWPHGGANGVNIGSNNLADRNLIAGSTYYEIAVGAIGTASNVSIANNLIGTQADGDTKLANPNSYGVFPQNGATGVTIVDNTIGAGAFGISFTGPAGDAAVARNRIGIGVNGGNIAGNRGILIYDQPHALAPSNILIGGNAGEGNVITNWSNDGIQVQRGAPTGGDPIGIAIYGNAIYNNGGLGINFIDIVNNINLGVDANDAGDADSGPNGFQNYPVITSAVSDGATSQVDFTLDSAANTSYRVDMYVSPSCDPSGYGEGQTYRGWGVLQTDATGHLANYLWSASPLPLGQYVTLTATDTGTHDTSEFSACALVQAPPGTPPPNRGVPIPTISRLGYLLLALVLILLGTRRIAGSTNGVQ